MTDLYSDKDILNVFKDDGVKKVFIGEGIQNFPHVELKKIKERCGEPPWVARVIYNEHFGCTLICQMPGAGCRFHYHPEADETWVILEGEFEWYMEGRGVIQAKEKDIVFVKRGMKHQIRCIGPVPGIRYAITAPDVNHVYCERTDGNDWHKK